MFVHRRARRSRGTSTSRSAPPWPGRWPRPSAIYLLAIREGVTGYRLVLVGIGITAMLQLGRRLPAHPGRDPGRPAGRRLAHRQPQRPGLGRRPPHRAGARRPRPVLLAARPSPPGARAGRRRRRRARRPHRAGPPGAAGVRRRPRRRGHRRGRPGRPSWRSSSPQIARRLVGERSLGLHPGRRLSAPACWWSSDLVARRHLRPHRAARRRRDRHPRRAVPAVAARPGQQGREHRMTASTPRSPRRRPTPAGHDAVPTGAACRLGPTGLARLRRPAHRRRPVAVDPDRAGDRHRRAPTPAGSRRCCGASARLLKPRAGTVLLDGEEIRRLPTREVAQRLGILPQQPIAPDGHHRVRPRRPAAATRTSAGSASGPPGTRPPCDAGPRRHGPRRPRRPLGRRAVGRPAPAGVDRPGPGPGHRAHAARRAHHLPRPRPPGRGARPARRPERAGGAHDRGRAPRPQPGLPLRPPPRGHGARARSWPRARRPRS